MTLWIKVLIKVFVFLGRKHDVVACVVNDAAEYSLPQMGVIEVQDAETGEVLTVDTSSAGF